MSVSLILSSIFAIFLRKRLTLYHNYGLIQQQVARLPCLKFSSLRTDISGGFVLALRLGTSLIHSASITMGFWAVTQVSCAKQTQEYSLGVILLLVFLHCF